MRGLDWAGLRTYDWSRVEVLNLDELRSYVPYALAREGWRFLPSGAVAPNPTNLPPAHFPAFLYESYKADVREANRRRPGRQALKTAAYADFKRVYDMLQDAAAAELRAAVVTAVASSEGGENLAPLRLFARALTGTEDETTALVLAHFLANVKRKMQGLPVTYQIMPILTGRQKSGKSTAVRQLLGPLGDTSHETTVTSSLRAENFTLFSQFYVVVFDEMEGIQKSSIAALKKMVTEERAGGRLYYTQRNVNLPNLCSFIGTANDSAMELIDDKTGARRFFEVKCADRLDWAALNGLDYAALWRGIDADAKAKYYLQAEADIDRRQAELVSVDMFRMFLDENHLLPKLTLQNSTLKPNSGPDESSPGSLWLSSAALYRAYSAWLEAYRVQPLHPASFFKKLAASGFERKTRTVVSGERRTTLTLYRVSSASQLAVEEQAMRRKLSKGDE